MATAQQWSQDYQLISDIPADNLLPWLDRPAANIDWMRDPANAPYFSQWREKGVVILPKFIPDTLIEPYFSVRAKVTAPHGFPDPHNPEGLPDSNPYLYVKELRDLALYPELMSILDALIGYRMGLHLNLAGWVSTERAWHQDDYLNPDFVNSHYAAVWIALRDIHPDSGPFEYVPGSHRWPLTRRDKVLANCPVRTSASDPKWPLITQDWISDIVEKEIDAQGAQVHKFLAKQGDVLIWHGRLMHRGSLANIPGSPRHSLIAHYSAIEKRLDMKDWNDRCFIPGGRAGEWK